MLKLPCDFSNVYSNVAVDETLRPCFHFDSEEDQPRYYWKSKPWQMKYLEKEGQESNDDDYRASAYQFRRVHSYMSPEARALHHKICGQRNEDTDASAMGKVADQLFRKVGDQIPPNWEQKFHGGIGANPNQVVEDEGVQDFRR